MHNLLRQRVSSLGAADMRVLILCTGNSARSQMAEGLLRHDGGPEYEVFSAGTHPSHVRPEAIQVMREAGIDISGHRSNPLRSLPGNISIMSSPCVITPKRVARFFPPRPSGFTGASKTPRPYEARKSKGWPNSGASATNSGRASTSSHGKENNAPGRQPSRCSGWPGRFAELPERFFWIWADAINACTTGRGQRHWNR